MMDLDVKSLGAGSGSKSCYRYGILSRQVLVPDGVMVAINDRIGIAYIRLDLNDESLVRLNEERDGATCT